MAPKLWFGEGVNTPILETGQAFVAGLTISVAIPEERVVGRATQTGDVVHWVWVFLAHADADPNVVGNKGLFVLRSWWP